MIRLKLLVDWNDPSGKEFKALDVIELEEKDKDLAAKLIFEKTAEHAAPEKPDTKQTVTQEMVSKAVADAMKSTEERLRVEFVKDKSDDDPFAGYMPGFNGTAKDAHELPIEAKTRGLGNFAKDVYAASSGDGSRPERLTKSLERSRAVISKAIADKLIDKDAGDGLTIGADSEGGFLVPPEFSLMLLDAKLEAAVVRPRATKMQIGSDRIELPQLKNYDHSGNLVYGGILAYWKGENVQYTATKAEFEEIALNLNALTSMGFASHKIMRFSPISVGSFVLPKMAEAMAWKEDDGFINGTGAGMPLGLLKAPGIVSIAIESGQTLANGPIVAKNIDKMYAQLRMEKMASTIWIYNHPQLWPSLADLKRTVGTGGSAAGLVQFMGTTPTKVLYGMPLVDTEHTQAVGTAGDIILADLSQYLIADDRQGPEISSSIHLKYDYGQTAFRIISYSDGQPRWRSSFTRQNGTAKVSPVVTLAARA